MNPTAQTDEKIGALRYVFSRRVLKRSALIAFSVGILLSVVNQFDVILREPMDARLGVKLLMNFFIPFAVSSVSALLNRSGR